VNFLGQIDTTDLLPIGRSIGFRIWDYQIYPKVVKDLAITSVNNITKCSKKHLAKFLLAWMHL
ncbi:hypothetical protein GIB67_009041, partial [Kingdonia uniflora]